MHDSSEYWIRRKFFFMDHCPTSLSFNNYITANRMYNYTNNILNVLMDIKFCDRKGFKHNNNI